MATELRDCQSNMVYDHQTVQQSIPDIQTLHKESKYNEGKIKILAAISYLESRNEIANNARIRILSGFDANIVSSQLTRLRNGYIKRELDNYTTNGCTLKVKMIDKGRRKFEAMLDRLENNLTLNLRSLPKKKDYSKFILLPGIEEYERLRAEGKI